MVGTRGIDYSANGVSCCNCHTNTISTFLIEIQSFIPCKPFTNPTNAILKLYKFNIEFILMILHFKHNFFGNARKQIQYHLKNNTKSTKTSVHVVDTCFNSYIIILVTTKRVFWRQMKQYAFN